LPFRLDSKNTAGTLLGLATDSLLRSVKTRFAYLAMAITGLRNRTRRRKQDRGEEQSQEEAYSLHHPMIRHDFMPALYRLDC
jgi:hypothetical protein